MLNKKNPFIVLSLIILANILTYNLNYKVDLTEEQRFTLSDQSIKIISNIDDNLTVKIYLKGSLPAGFQLFSASLKNFILNIKKINNKIDFEFINPNDAENEEERLKIFNQLQGQGLYATDLTIKKSSETSRKIIFPGAIIYYKEKREAINLLENNFGVSPQENINNSIENIEFKIISTINKLLSNNKLKIGFLKGNGELPSNALKDITESVNKDNNNLKYYYNVEDVNLKEFEVDTITNKPNITKQLNKLLNYKVLIIAKPTIAFNKLDKLLIDQYLMNGGRLLFFIDGVNASLDSLNNKNGYFISSKNNLNIDDQFFKYGFRVNSDLIQDQRSIEIPIITGYSNNKPIQEFFKWPYYPLLKNSSNNPISKNIDAIKCDFVSSIDTIKNNIKKTILLASSVKSRKVLSPSKISLSILENPPPIETFNKPNIPISVLLSGSFTSVFKDRIISKENSLNFKDISKETKIIVVADGDFIANPVSNKGIAYPLGYDKFINYTYEGNKKFIINAIQYLCDDSGLVNLKSKNIKLRMLNVEKINNNKRLIILLNIFIPLLIFMFLILIFKTTYQRKYD
jgi:ABC-2 type transport system permease protein